MAQWGLAYASGPNYNHMWDVLRPAEDLAEPVASTHAATERALALAEPASPVERALIGALRRATQAPRRSRTAWSGTTPTPTRCAPSTREHPDDLDVAALFAEALMNRTAWALWDVDHGTPAEGADTAEAIAALERGIAAWPEHPGLLHFYVHADGDVAVPGAGAAGGRPAAHARPRRRPPRAHGDPHRRAVRQLPRRRDLEPGRHRAPTARYHALAGADNFYTVYRCHDYHFTIYGAMFLGQLEPALAAADELRENLPESLLRTGGWADWLEGFVPMGLHALIRFGRWDDILAEPLPDDPELYTVTTAMLHYARGVALAATGQVDEADAERDLFRAAVERVTEDRYLFNNTCRDILGVAGAMLDGEVEYRRGNHDAAFAHLRRSVQLDDTLVYDEPWGWMQPARHALGALLLEQDRVEDAAAVYRADLGLDATLRRPCQHPENVWSLHGYHECLVRLGRTAEAEMIRPRLDLALARATVPIRASCFCRRSVAA